MASKNSPIDIDKIKEEINKLPHNIDGKDIKQFLEDKDTHMKDFIQKYVETEVAIFGTETTYAAFKITLLVFAAAIIISSIIATSPEAMQKYGYITVAFNFLVFFGLLYKFKNDSTEKNIQKFKKIILAIEAEKLTKKTTAEEDLDNLL